MWKAPWNTVVAVMVIDNFGVPETKTKVRNLRLNTTREIVKFLNLKQV